jgi:hypothetical protein
MRKLAQLVIRQHVINGQSEDFLHATAVYELAQCLALQTASVTGISDIVVAYASLLLLGGDIDAPSIDDLYLGIGDIILGERDSLLAHET